MTFKEAVVKFEKLKQSQLQFDKVIRYEHLDGSICIYHHAQYVHIDMYVFLFTEHNGHHLLYFDDLKSIGEVND